MKIGSPRPIPARQDEAITAEFVRGLFVAFYAAKKRPRSIPTVGQCQPLAFIATQYYNHLNLPKKQAPANLQSATNKSADVVKTSKSLSGELKKLIFSLESIPSPPEELVPVLGPGLPFGTDEFERFKELDRYTAVKNEILWAKDLLDATSKYLDFHDIKPAEIKSKERCYYIKRLQTFVVHAIEMAGHKVVSRDSDNGPVSFVVAKLLSHIEGRDTQPSSIRSFVKLGKNKSTNST